MSPLAWIKLALAAAVLACACLGTWYVTRDHYQVQIERMQKEWSQQYAKAVEEQRDAAADLLKTRQQAEVQHDQDQRTITDLHARAERVRIHIPTCGSPAGEAGQSGAGADVSTGALPGTVDAAFADLQAAAGGLVQQCDQLNIDAIRLNREVGQ